MQLALLDDPDDTLVLADAPRGSGRRLATLEEPHGVAPLLRLALLRLRRAGLPPPGLRLRRFSSTRGVLADDAAVPSQSLLATAALRSLLWPTLPGLRSSTLLGTHKTNEPTTLAAPRQLAAWPRLPRPSPRAPVITSAAPPSSAPSKRYEGVKRAAPGTGLYRLPSSTSGCWGETFSL